MASSSSYRVLRAALFVSALSAIAAPSLAATPGITEFFGEDQNPVESTPLTSHPQSDAAHSQFFANLKNPGVESFESFTDGQTAPLSVTFGSTTATITGEGNIVADPGSEGVGRYAITGSKFYEVSGMFDLAFTQPQAAFGFYASDVGDFNGQVTLTLANGGKTMLTVPSSASNTGGNVLFYGIVADAANVFTGISFGNTAAGVDIFGFDDFTIGTLGQIKPPGPPTGVPLPSAAWAGLGMLGLGALVRARKWVARAV